MEGTFNRDFTRFLVENEVYLLFFCLIIAFVSFACIEGVRPRKPQSRQQLRRRWPVNFGLIALNQINVVWLTAFYALVVAWWTDGNNIGVLGRLEMGFWSSTLITFLAFELISYVFHRLLHSVPLLWRIHAVHHCDTDIDFTTTFRNHPFEVLVTAPIGTVAVILLGFPVASIILYQIARTAIIVFAHSNIQLPEKVDRYLRLFIVTPDFHRLHHSRVQHYTDSNFCPAFPLYDYLFNTATKVPYTKLPSMRLGLDYLDKPEQTGLINLLLMPFIWRRLTSRSGLNTRDAPAGSQSAI